jgi:hypothetical protein
VADGIAGAIRAAGTRLLLAEPLEGTQAVRAENAGLALAIAIACGADRDLAIAGMNNYAPDPGAFALRTLALPGGGGIVLVDALAAEADGTVVFGVGNWKGLGTILRSWSAVSREGDS